MLHDEVQNNKLQILGKLAASLAHEIRNPLSAIKLNLEYIKMSEASPEVQESIESCIDAAMRIQTLIETTLNFSRTSLNDCYYQSLNEIVLLATEIMAPKARILNIDIEPQLDEGSPALYLNKNKILQVLLNMLTNAIEAIEKNGHVKVKTYSEQLEGKETVTLEIQDTGSGISEESREKIFNDFYTNKKEGTGLGLSVCKMILEEYTADMSFESVPGQGTRFFVRFNPNFNGAK